MSRPQRYLNRMFLFLLAVGAVAFLLYPALSTAFRVNAPLNGLILGVLVTGILYIFRQVTRLFREVRWLNDFRAARGGRIIEPVLLSPIANMLGDKRGERIRLSAPAMRSVLDGLGSRLDESRELSRYFINLLIFLGLLGTFWGLLGTIHSVGAVLGSLSVEAGGDVATMFGNLQHGLEAPLTGMGSAFSASLFGLAGSLVLGFLELQANQAQNRFFQEVEDWLAGGTRLTGGTVSEGEQSVPVYLGVLLEQTAENIDTLQRTMALAEEGRRNSNVSLATLAEKLSTLTDQMRAEQTLLVSLAETLMSFKPLLSRLTENASAGGLGLDETARQHIRNIDISLARLVDEASTGRDKAVLDVRSDIKLIARTIAALAEDTEQR